MRAIYREVIKINDYEQLSFIDLADPNVCKSSKIAFDDYEKFVDKFKPQKTTDDCYTPPIVYDAIANWVAAKYNVSRADFVRPFYPGWNYQNLDYTGKIVVDNPPFSILGQIVSYYDMAGVKFFLFAPQLTSMKHSLKNCCFICTDCSVTYENGANVNTAFLTNLEPHEIAIKTNPELSRIVDDANARARKERKPPELPKYKYPPEVISIALVSTFARHGIPVTIRRDELYPILGLESQKRQGKNIFGGGFLTSHTKGQELEEARRRAEEARRRVWELSPRETAICDELENLRSDKK